MDREKEKESGGTTTVKLECGRQRGGNETAMEKRKKKPVIELNRVPGPFSGSMRRESDVGLSERAGHTSYVCRK